MVKAQLPELQFLRSFSRRWGKDSRKAILTGYLQLYKVGVIPPGQRATHIGGKRKVKQFHWGGGTPTFLSEDQIERLFAKAQETFDIDLDGEVAIEIDPRTIDKSKVEKLRSIGFNRVSMGVQDFDPKVQEVINRRQEYHMVKEFNAQCRELGFKSINFDLIYGLPLQTKESFSETVSKAIDLRPDRIALYSFAYVPWLKKLCEFRHKVPLL